MSTQPTNRLKGFNFQQKITQKGDVGDVDFMRFLALITSLLNFQGRLVPPTTTTVGASPFVITNNTGNDESVIVNAGTVSKIEYSRNGGGYITVGTVAGMFALSPLDSLRVTYTVAPTITVVVR